MDASSEYKSDQTYRPGLTRILPSGAGYREDAYVGVYLLNFDDSGNFLVRESPVGGRCVLSDEAARNSVLNALKDPPVKSGDYQLRWLSIPDLLIECVWLRSRAGNLPDVIAPVFHKESSLIRKDLLTVADFRNIVRDLLRHQRQYERIGDS